MSPNLISTSASGTRSAASWSGSARLRAPRPLQLSTPSHRCAAVPGQTPSPGRSSRPRCSPPPARGSTPGSSMRSSARSAPAGSTPTCTPRPSGPGKSAVNSEVATAVITTTIDNPHRERKGAFRRPFLSKVLRTLVRVLPCLFDDRPPLRDFRLQEFVQGFGPRALCAHRLGAELGEVRLEIRVFDRLLQRGVQAVHHRLRRALGHIQSVPHHDLESLQSLLEVVVWHGLNVPKG